MPHVDRPGCRLAYELLDVTPAWIEEPETIVFYHGVSGHRRVVGGLDCGSLRPLPYLDVRHARLRPVVAA